MKVYPWEEVVKAVGERTRNPNTIAFQQFNCAHCGVKQTMDEPNVFHMSGRCEECGKLTNIKKRGMNYMLYITPPGISALAEWKRLKESEVQRDEKYGKDHSPEE